MKYTQKDRQAINSLTTNQMQLFEMLETCEQVAFIGVPELCSALQADPSFIVFSCLSGSAKTQELGQNLGVLFETSLNRHAQRFHKSLQEAGYQNDLLVIIDDCEPCRVWQWDTPQQEITTWCKLVIETTQIPVGWSVQLWSEIEQRANICFDDVLCRMSQQCHSLLVWQHCEHMQKYPNKKLRGDVATAALRRVADYALQGLVLQTVIPHGILCQSETPWSAKDPLFNPLRQNKLPIIHPFKIPNERK